MSIITLQELNLHLDLRGRLARDMELLSSLEAAAYPGAQNLDGMPRSSGIHDKVGNLAAEIADMKEQIRYLNEEISNQEKKVLVFINSIENDQTRTIFRLRFIRCLTWKEVAMVIGGRNTAESVKSACYRFLGTGCL